MYLCKCNRSKLRDVNHFRLSAHQYFATYYRLVRGLAKYHNVFEGFNQTLHVARLSVHLVSLSLLAEWQLLRIVLAIFVQSIYLV
jgi:hypothetical protein